MKSQITYQVVDLRTEDDLLGIVELEDRLELAAIQECRCCTRCNDFGNQDPISL